MSPSVLKVAVAFVAGLILALASALVYVRIQDKQPPVATSHVEQVPSIPEPLPQTSRVPATAPETGSPESVQEEDAPAAVPSKQKKPPRTRANVRPSMQVPVQVIENKPLPAVEKQPVPPVPDAAPSGYPPMSQAQSPQQAADTRLGTQADPDPSRQPHEVELPAGTSLAIRLGEALSTEGNYPGDTFRGVLIQPVIRDGFIIADRDSKVLGRVVTADRAGRIQGVSQLSVTLTEINTTDGQRVAVKTNLIEKRGPTSTGVDTAKIAGGAALGALIGALSGGGKGAAIGAGAGGAAGTGLVLATRGKGATLPNEAQLSFQLLSPVRITEKLNR
jgi:hypothetical protein